MLRLNFKISSFCRIFSFKNKRWERGKNIHFLKVLFKAYEKIIIWCL